MIGRYAKIHGILSECQHSAQFCPNVTIHSLLGIILGYDKNQLWFFKEKYKI